LNKLSLKISRDARVVAFSLERSDEGCYQSSALTFDEKSELGMDSISLRVLGMFSVWGKDVLDLHELFEAAGNDPEQRTAVFDAVERLVSQGLLNEEGNDFYSLTQSGRKILEGKVDRSD
jgi:hypothetical protein